MMLAIIVAVMGGIPIPIPIYRIFLVPIPIPTSGFFSANPDTFYPEYLKDWMK